MPTIFSQHVTNISLDNVVKSLSNSSFQLSPTYHDIFIDGTGEHIGYIVNPYLNLLDPETGLLT